MATKYQFDKNSHSVYALHYHLIIVVKYRQKAFTSQNITDDLKHQTKKIAEKFSITITNQECDTDHTHILFKTKPQTDLIKFINALKGTSARILRNKYKTKLKNTLWGDSFWNESYCLITTGQTTLDQLKKYVDSQPKKCSLRKKSK